MRRKRIIPRSLSFRRRQFARREQFFNLPVQHFKAAGQRPHRAPVTIHSVGYLRADHAPFAPEQFERVFAPLNFGDALGFGQAQVAHRLDFAPGEFLMRFERGRCSVVGQRAY